jgi:hypothetical protein
MPSMPLISPNNLSHNVATPYPHFARARLVLPGRLPGGVQVWMSSVFPLPAGGCPGAARAGCDRVALLIKKNATFQGNSVLGPNLAKTTMSATSNPVNLYEPSVWGMT